MSVPKTCQWRDCDAPATDGIVRPYGGLAWCCELHATAAEIHDGQDVSERPAAVVEDARALLAASTSGKTAKEAPE